MSIETLLASLRAVRPPAAVEEWVRADQQGDATPHISDDYHQAVLDMLALLGVLADGSDQVDSPAAYYFIQSLLYSRRDGTLSPDVWRAMNSDGCDGLGTRLLHMLEAHRIACSDSPTPVRIVEAVMSVIKSRQGDHDAYLMQYDEKAAQFQPLGGKREAYDESSVAALTRELCEELNIPALTLGQDFQARSLREHIKVHEVSASVHVVTRYDHSFYHLTDVRFPLVLDKITRWISEAELTALKTHDGLAITSLYDEYLPGLLKTLPYSVAEA